MRLTPAKKRQFLLQNPKSKVITKTDLAKVRNTRVHGGGFAGTIQAFVPNDIVDIYKKNMEDIFGQDACHVLKIRKYGGMKVL